MRYFFQKGNGIILLGDKTIPIHNNMILFIFPFQQQKWEVDEDALDFKFVISQEKFINDLKRPYGFWLIPLAGGRVLEIGCWKLGAEDGAQRPPFYYCLQYSYLWEGAIKASDIIVGRGSPRPVLHVITFACWWMSAGGRGTEATVLLWFAILLLIHC